MRKLNFTLLELLLAMFIMGALVTVAIPVFRTLIKGKDTERAATEL
jgi:Tfp pilus assembly protein FimT